MAAHKETGFTDKVKAAFLVEQEGARALWVPLGQQLDSDGPDAVNVYLEAQRQQLVDHVKTLLSRVEEKING